ncbi:ATP-binding protein [Xenorhabdus sp. Flor]|uniref:IS21-like element helper ATPase IstB n=1 Tax=Xenorhabdus cabanillasii TaxID=351673 RepID=UPI0019B1102D|nr:IS21-like element helper ATPase IstB [Xenorhabdus sp. Flor]MBD2816730.1 ATP-binding protein [Xenorhabdus sp. Flor]
MNSLYEYLTELRLTGFREALRQQLSLPTSYHELSFEERLLLLVEEEITHRRNQKGERFIRQARFRLQGELEALDYRASRGLEKAQVRSLAQAQWLKQHQNLLLTGATGSGKTYFACALGRHYCRQGYTVYYYRVKGLLAQCYQSHGEGSYPRLLSKLSRSQLLILDDWGLESLSADQRSDLLEIVDQLYQRGSVLLISQLPIEKWHQMIGDATHADAILDRLVHRSIKIELKGESMRKQGATLTDGDQSI